VVTAYRANPSVIVRRYRQRRLGLVVIGLLLTVAGFYSHARHRDYASELQGQYVIVDQVLHGDRVRIRTPDHRLEEVSLKGIDAPELSPAGQPPAHFASQAKQYLHQRIDGKKVVLRFEGTQRRDPDGRLIAYVYLNDNECINLSLVHYGYAYVDRRQTGYLSSRMGQAEAEARRKQRGLWKDLTPEQMPEWRRNWLKTRLLRNKSENED
jgi:endonuclease YncB( thermonuclease family)